MFFNNTVQKRVWWRKNGGGGSNKDIDSNEKGKTVTKGKERLMEMTPVAPRWKNTHKTSKAQEHTMFRGRWGDKKKHKNQAQSIKWHINSNGRRGGEDIKEADENTRRVERVEGRKRAHLVCHRLHPSFLPSSSALTHLFTVCSFLRSLFPSPHPSSPLSFLSLCHFLSRYHTFSALAPLPANKGTKWEGGTSERGATKGRGEDGVALVSSYHGGEDVLVKCWCHPQLWRL